MNVRYCKRRVNSNKEFHDIFIRVLYDACERGNASKVRLLLQNPENVEALNDYFVWFFFLKYLHINIVFILMKGSYV